MRRRASGQRTGADLGRNILAVLLGLALILVPLEIGLRLVQRSFDPRTLVYPRVANEINGFKDPGFGKRVPHGEYRILALGASAFVTRNFRAEFERLLNESPLFLRRGLRVRVISTGVPAHMTWDSLWKYRYWYRGYDFDLVIFYHGINDARANCYPRHVFRDDYTQLPYYAQYAPVFHWIDRHPVVSRSFVASLFATVLARTRVRWAPDFQRKDPYNDPRHDSWLGEGSDIKTEPVFERNLEEIVALARQRGQRLLLLTYAYYLPADYTNARFLDRSLDYDFAPESVPAEIWGLPANVVKAIEVHNAVIRRVASRHPDVLFFDLERHIPKDRRYFIDICHWTDRGRERFVDGVLQVLPLQ